MAKTFRIKDKIGLQPVLEVPITDVWAVCMAGGAIKVLSPVELHTDRQRRWYKGICLRSLSDWNGDTIGEWDLRLKALCGGNELLKKETIYIGKGQTCERLTIVGVSKKNMTQYIENILSLAIKEDWPVTPPDPELRSG